MRKSQESRALEVKVLNKHGAGTTSHTQEAPASKPMKAGKEAAATLGHRREMTHCPLPSSPKDPGQRDFGALPAALPIPVLRQSGQLDPSTPQPRHPRGQDNTAGSPSPTESRTEIAISEHAHLPPTGSFRAVCRGSAENTPRRPCCPGPASAQGVPAVWVSNREPWRARGNHSGRFC